MARALLGVLVLLGASCATEQTDPPGRAIGLPSRDGGGDAASGASALEHSGATAGGGTHPGLQERVQNMNSCPLQPGPA